MKRHRIPAAAMVALLVGSFCVRAEAAQAKTLRFSGYVWDVRPAGDGGPGPNHWNPNNVWVDTKGWLHLKITKDGDQWSCAEISTQRRLGFGRYQFQVIGRLDQFDQNVVLGLFDYPTPDVGPDGTNEIDIEIARWGNPQWPNGNYTVYPAKSGVTPRSGSHTFHFTLTGGYTTHRFVRTSAQVAFQSLYGHRNDNQNEFAHWIFSPTDPLTHVPQQPLPIHINLWLFRGKAPTNGQEVEVVIQHFTFTRGTG